MIERKKIRFTKAKSSVEIKEIVVETQRIVRINADENVEAMSEYIAGRVNKFHFGKPKAKTKEDYMKFCREIAESLFYEGYCQGWNDGVGPTWKDLKNTRGGYERD